MSLKTRNQYKKQGLRVPEKRNEDGSEYFPPEPEETTVEVTIYDRFDFLIGSGHQSLRMYVTKRHFPYAMLTRTEAESLRQRLLRDLKNQRMRSTAYALSEGTFVEGTLMFECFNKSCLALLRKVTYPMRNRFKLVDGKALQSPNQYMVTFPEGPGCSNEYILTMVENQNPVAALRWEVLVRTDKPDNMAELRVTIDPKSYKALTLTNFTLHYKGREIVMDSIRVNLKLDDPGADIDLPADSLDTRRGTKRQRDGEEVDSSFTDGGGPSSSQNFRYGPRNHPPQNQFVGNHFGNCPPNYQSFSAGNQPWNEQSSGFGTFGYEPNNQYFNNQFPNNFGQFGNHPRDGPFFNNSQSFNNFGNRPPNNRFFSDPNFGGYLNQPNQNRYDQFGNFNGGGNSSNRQY